jgi:DNA polymerase-3 subunit epsilon
MDLPFTLDRPLVFFDLETTGLSLKNDRIVELAFIKITPQGDVMERVRRFNPGVPIPPEATAVHGITDADVADEATFCQRARVIDVQNIFHREEPRDLSAAARFYLGREHEEAHTALGDIRTSAAVLGAQMQRYAHLPQDLEGLHAYCESYAPFLTDVDRWFGPTEEGRVFRRGKHKGRPLDEVARTEADYLHWMLGAEDMPDEVLRIVRDALANAAQASLETNGPGSNESDPNPENERP